VDGDHSTMTILHASRLMPGLAILVAGILAGISPEPASAQRPDAVLQTISSAVSDGDADRLVSTTSSRLELALMGASRQYSQSQAALVLKKFFQENRPRSFEIVDSTSASRGLFVEARLRTAEPDLTLRVYFRLNRTGDAWRLREMLIERADR
jgi:hypothetical protein